jgi:osmotically-inducible protein OsmY
VALSIASIACDNTAQGMREDAAEAKRDAGQAASDARDTADRVGERASDVAHEAGDKTGNVIENAGRAGDAAMETFDVKAALMADNTVDASGINVDTDHVTKTVVLKGHVPTAAQKTAAEDIAKRKAVGYRVDNQLTIGK